MGFGGCGGVSGCFGDVVEARRGFPSSCELDLGFEEGMVKKPVPDKVFLCICDEGLLLEELLDIMKWTTGSLYASATRRTLSYPSVGVDMNPMLAAFNATHPIIPNHRVSQSVLMIWPESTTCHSETCRRVDQTRH
jgi:hypothetical protein